LFAEYPEYHEQQPLEFDEIKWIISGVREIFASQPILLDLGAPLKICGTNYNLHS
jgi:hypothetical protein